MLLFTKWPIVFYNSIHEEKKIRNQIIKIKIRKKNVTACVI